MNYSAKNIRAFIGAKDYEESKEFYSKLGFKIVDIPGDMVLVKVNDDLVFYLQNYYQKKWVQNSMIFLEADDIESCYVDLLLRDLVSQICKAE